MAACGRVPWITILNRQKVCGCSCWSSKRYASQQTEVAEVYKTEIPKGQITLPMKKKRDSLSILKALSSTVDITKGPEYAAIDDPYLLTHKKDMFISSLAKASGQRAARYFVNKYRNAFDHDDMAPFVQAFQPDDLEYKFTNLCDDAIRERVAFFSTKSYGAFQPDDLEYKFTNLCDDAIRERVQRREVVKAVQVYEKMNQQGIMVSEEVKLELLELMCVYESKDPDEKRLPLELVFHVQLEDKEAASTLAIDVYNDLEEKTSDAQNWIIQSFFRFGEGEQAISRYREMKANGVPVHRNTYHCMLRKSTLLANLTNSKTSEAVMSIFQEMVNAEIQPNLETFHSCISGLMRSRFLFIECLPKILAEMKVLDIEPTYQTWNLALQNMSTIVPSNRRDQFMVKPPSESILAHVGQYVGDSIEHMKKHPEETFCSIKGHYFLSAMKICHYLQDPELAILVNDFKDSLGNKYVPSKVYQEEAYYLQLFDLLNRTESCQTILDIYNKTYSQLWLDPETFIKVLVAIETFKEYQHLPMLFEDYMSRSAPYPEYSVIEALFHMMALPGHTEELNTYFKGAAEHLFALSKQFFFIDPNKRSENFRLDWDAHTHMINIFINNGDLETAWECLMLCFEKKERLNKFCWTPSLHHLLDAIIDEADQAKLDMFVGIADISMSHSVDINAYRPRLETFMSNEDIEALEAGQKKRMKQKYNL